MIGGERNQTRELPDAKAHAEMMAIRRACEDTGVMELRSATLYSTLQPCGMCTMASIWSKVERVVYGAGRDDIEIVGGCLREECAALYYPPDADLAEEQRAIL